MAYPHPAFMGKTPMGSDWTPAGFGPAGPRPGWMGPTPGMSPVPGMGGWMGPAAGKAQPGWGNSGKATPGWMAPPRTYPQPGPPMYMHLPGYALAYPGEIDEVPTTVLQLLAVIEPALNSVLPAIEGLLRIPALLLGQHEEADLMATWSGPVSDTSSFDGSMPASAHPYPAGEQQPGDRGLGNGWDAGPWWPEAP